MTDARASHSLPAAPPAPPAASIKAPFAALLTAVLSFSLMQTMLVPVLPDLQQELRTSTTGISWILSSFLITASVATPLLGRVGDMIGKRRVLLGCLSVFALGTLLCALSTSLALLITARAVQGVGAAAFPLAFGIVRDQFPSEKAPVAISLISSTFGIGFGIGLVLPGPIVDTLNWHWIFWLGLAVILAALFAVAAFVKESATRSPGPIDWAGGVLLSAAVVALLLPISQGNAWGWNSPAVIGLFTAAAVLGAVFLAVERRAPQPMIELDLLRRPAVATSHVTALIIGFATYSAFTLIPLLVRTPPGAGYGFGSSVTESGLFMLPTAVTMLLVSPLAGRIGAAVGFRTPLVLACLTGIAGFALYAAHHDSKPALYTASAVLGISTGLAYAALANLVIGAVDPHQVGQATGINTIMRTIGSSLGAQTAATLLTSTTIPGTRTPAETGYTTTFTLSAVALAFATLITLTAPRGPRTDSPPSP